MVFCAFVMFFQAKLIKNKIIIFGNPIYHTDYCICFYLTWLCSSKKIKSFFTFNKDLFICSSLYLKINRIAALFVVFLERGVHAWVKKNQLTPLRFSGEPPRFLNRVGFLFFLKKKPPLWGGKLFSDKASRLKKKNPKHNALPGITITILAESVFEMFF